MIPFDFASRLLSSADSSLRAFVPGWASLLVWGALAGFISTALYRMLSQRERIREATVRACELRAAMLAYSGDFEGLLWLVKRSLVAALCQLRLVLGPAAVASLPGLIVIAYVSHAYVVSATTPTAASFGANWLRSCEGAFFASASIFSALANAIFRTR